MNMKNTLDLTHEADALEGNINRMLVTDDLEELDLMRLWAIKRLEQIYIAKVDF